MRRRFESRDRRGDLACRHAEVMRRAGGESDVLDVGATQKPGAALRPLAVAKDERERAALRRKRYPFDRAIAAVSRRQRAASALAIHPRRPAVARVETARSSVRGEMIGQFPLCRKDVFKRAERLQMLLCDTGHQPVNRLDHFAYLGDVAPLARADLGNEDLRILGHRGDAEAYPGGRVVTLWRREHAIARGQHRGEIGLDPRLAETAGDRDRQQLGLCGERTAAAAFILRGDRPLAGQRKRKRDISRSGRKRIRCRGKKPRPPHSRAARRKLCRDPRRRTDKQPRRAQSDKARGDARRSFGKAFERAHGQRDGKDGEKRRKRKVCQIAGKQCGKRAHRRRGERRQLRTQSELARLAVAYRAVTGQLEQRKERQRRGEHPERAKRRDHTTPSASARIAAAIVTA